MVDDTLINNIEDTEIQKTPDPSKIIDVTIENIKKYSEIFISEIFVSSYIKNDENKEFLVFRLGESEKKSIVYRLEILDTTSTVFIKLQISMLLVTNENKNELDSLKFINKINKSFNTNVSLLKENLILFKFANFIKKRSEIREVLTIFTLMSQMISASNIAFTNKDL